MELRQIETFVQVAELGSFTRAAAVLRTAQPALSRQVRALEVELRQTLFDRNGRGVTLTAAGRRLLAHGRGILQQVARAREDLEEGRGAAVGRLHLGLPPSLSRSATTALVEAFAEQLPRVALAVAEGLSTVMLEWLAQGRLDAAAVYQAPPSPTFERLPVGHETLYLVSAPPARAAPGAPAPRGAPPPKALRAARPRPATLEEVARRPLVIPGRPHAIRMRLESALAAHSLTPTIALEIDSVPALLDLVRRRAGLHAVVSLNAVRASGHADTLLARPIAETPGHPLAVTLWLATAAQRPRGALMAQALPLVQAVLLRELRGP